MATNTPNYNLVKPELNEFADIRVLNGNMDIIDAQLKKASDIDLSNYATKPDLKNYLPLTGGNITGELTIQEKSITTIVDSWYSEDGLQYWIKYSDGRLEQRLYFDNYSSGTSSGWKYHIWNLLTPFVDTKYTVTLHMEVENTRTTGGNYIALTNTIIGEHNTLTNQGADFVVKQNNKFTSMIDTFTTMYATCLGRWK